MKKLVLGALIVLSGCAWSTGLLHSAPAEQRAWRHACSLSGLDCRGIDPPQVVTSKNIFGLTPELWFALGFYLPGEDIVYILPMKDADKYLVVLTHEMVHYINNKLGLHENAVCDNEASAFAVGDALARKLGREDLVRGDRWWEPYGHCQNYGGSDGNTEATAGPDNGDS